VLNIKPKQNCRWDLAALGEVILRFDPGEERIRNARNFRVWEGGGEYNVARNLANCFHLDTAIATALADNEIGRMVENLIIGAGVDKSLILWRQTDGISKKSRNGMYFWERGYGMRPAVGCSDRANTAVSQLKPDEIDWKSIFDAGVRWFHTGGIFAGLSDLTFEVAHDAMKCARESGSIISYDLNFRSSLWSERGGREAANSVNRQLLDQADVVFGVLDLEIDLAGFESAAIESAARKMFAEHPNLKLVASPVRTTHNESRQDLSGVAFDGQRVYRGPDFIDMSVYDRVGSGDAFAAGFIYELICGHDVEKAVATATAAAGVAMTTPGDHLLSSMDEIRVIADKVKHISSRR
jgi:2-dehydro-3-deoxygluconokinase